MSGMKPTGKKSPAGIPTAADRKSEATAAEEETVQQLREIGPGVDVGPELDFGFADADGRVGRSREWTHIEFDAKAVFVVLSISLPARCCRGCRC